MVVNFAELVLPFKSMNSLHIQSVVDTDIKLKDTFVGVFPSDRLPHSVNRFPSAFIVNVDRHDEPGSHWVAMYFNKYGQADFFDSFGRPPSLCSMHFKTFLDNHAKAWNFNTRSLQSHWSAVCGQYCLYVLLNRVKGNSMSSIVSRFTLNRTQNDRKVYAYIHSQRKLNVPMYDMDFILKGIDNKP